MSFDQMTGVPPTCRSASFERKKGKEHISRLPLKCLPSTRLWIHTASTTLCLAQAESRLSTIHDNDTYVVTLDIFQVLLTLFPTSRTGRTPSGLTNFVEMTLNYPVSSSWSNGLCSKNRSIILPGNSTLGIHPKEMASLCQKHLYTSANCSTILNSQNMVSP
jgi:hypothetical protein